MNYPEDHYLFRIMKIVETPYLDYDILKVNSQKMQLINDKIKVAKKKLQYAKDDFLKFAKNNPDLRRIDSVYSGMEHLNVIQSLRDQKAESDITLFPFQDFQEAIFKDLTEYLNELIKLRLEVEPGYILPLFDRNREGATLYSFLTNDFSDISEKRKKDIMSRFIDTGLFGVSHHLTETQFGIYLSSGILRQGDFNPSFGITYLIETHLYVQGRGWQRIN